MNSHDKEGVQDFPHPFAADEISKNTIYDIPDQQVRESLEDFANDPKPDKPK